MLRFVLVTTAILLLQSVASARTVSRTVRYNGTVYVLNNQLIVQPAPRVERPDHWQRARESYFQRMYGTSGYCR